MNTSYERLRADMAKRDVKAGKREPIASLDTRGLAVVTTILGVLIAGVPAA